ncbi:pentatricopeptide repeat-containing protein At1g08070, chloroplastic [Amborella trichopoda]|uniref:pentatricopeptide repeat-containing protein At1g08070, chloroplastic n=1 Tax=Amborella trichopoda TaxID=13333 RepID=UPI0009BD0D19|nr:pentatricopeptide repeat-containing protein At1g08070, chloroplastic [Amborella trichopoda]|eukprot:XP_011625833.2 pentatricopeptide repeat-containing protein At1g08070, chloroplastic [Amborella trichopoda]
MTAATPPYLFSLLRSSTSLRQIHQIHTQFLIHSIPLNNFFLTKLIQFNCTDYSSIVFDLIPQNNDYSWTLMIKSYATHGPLPYAFSLFIQMLKNDVKPTNFTFPPLLNACSRIPAAILGQQVHTQVAKLGLVSDIFTGNALVDMYSKCDCIVDAHRVFEEMPVKDQVSYNSMIHGYAKMGDLSCASHLFSEMPERNVISWTSLIGGYCRAGNIKEALETFKRMILSVEGPDPNTATMVSLLSACSSLCDLEAGRWVSCVIDINKVASSIVLNTSLIDMFAKCGDIIKARKVFDEMPFRNLVSWNAMVTGYSQCGLPNEAISLFREMGGEDVEPNEVTLVGVLSSCANLGALELGREIHNYVCENGLETNVILSTALIDMYAKCGSIESACLVFFKMPKRDVVSWNAMIVGLSMNGLGKEALVVFTNMRKAGVRPNDVTFLGALSGCSHSGLVDEGRYIFQEMVSQYNLSPNAEHYACMVDLLGRAGFLDEAFMLVRDMPFKPDPAIWAALLSSCRTHCNVKFASEIGQILMLSETPHLGSCILLSNVYASAGMWDEVARVRRLIKDKRLRKPAGCSWVEICGIVHRFVVEDSKHPQSEEIYDLLRGITKQLKVEGYVPELDLLLQSSEETQ